MPEKCKYLLPCGYCDKKGAKCEVFNDEMNSITINDLLNRQNQFCTNSTHQHEWVTIPTNSNYVVQKCKVCGCMNTDSDSNQT